MHTVSQTGPGLAVMESDSTTGLYYNRARYYDPSAGRFLSEDRVQFQGGINFFRYVRNNPANRVDPFGLNSAAGTIPWPRVLPFPIVSPWVRAIAGGIGALLGDLLWPDATNKEPQPCDRRKDDPCYIKYEEDAAWCGQTFTGGDDTLYDDCMAIAWLNYLRCTNHQTPIDPDPRKRVPPKGPTPPRKPK
jgi:RHS repeat-associated protein